MGANEGDIHSALPFVTEQRGGQRDADDGERDGVCACVCGGGGDARVFLGTKSESNGHWEKDVWGRGCQSASVYV